MPSSPILHSPPGLCSPTPSVRCRRSVRTGCRSVGTLRGASRRPGREPGGCSALEGERQSRGQGWAVVTHSHLFRVISFSRGHLGFSAPKSVPPGNVPGPAAGAGPQELAAATAGMKEPDAEPCARGLPGVTTTSWDILKTEARGAWPSPPPQTSGARLPYFGDRTFLAYRACPFREVWE